MKKKKKTHPIKRIQLSSSKGRSNPAPMTSITQFKWDCEESELTSNSFLSNDVVTFSIKIFLVFKGNILRMSDSVFFF